MIEVKILADSVSPANKRLTTFLVTYPRFIHSEIMTHRVLSRNSSSSRAVPVKKMLAAVANNPVVPASWGTNKSGMQAGANLAVPEAAKATDIWLRAAKEATKHVEELLALGVHKQISNRLLEPFNHMTTLITATEWENFFALRAHPDAQPEFQELAFAMLESYLASTPKILAVGQWHIPFGAELPLNMPLSDRLKIATARCARTSYITFDDPPDFAKDIVLHDRLRSSGHWSPFEHLASALDKPRQSGNFVGWRQYRKIFAEENRSCDLNNLYSARLAAHTDLLAEEY